MILPFLSGIPWLRKAPITWALVVLNLITYFAFTQFQPSGTGFLEKIQEDEFFLRAQGNIFSQFIQRHPEHYPEYLKKISSMALEGKVDSEDLMGSLAFRDLRFVLNAPKENFEGDKVRITYWKKKFQEFLEFQETNANFRWGLSLQRDEPFYWISYQFVHGGAFHLLGNLWFLLIFGGFLEPLIGSLTLLVLYLASGVFGAAAFLIFSGGIAVPLVGASGAISGLMGLFAAISWKRPVRFMFWLLPFRGYSGFINLPAWVALTFWLVSDLKGYIGTLSEFGGVAHITHLGGLAIGLLSGLLFTQRLRRKELPMEAWIEKRGVYLPELDKIRERYETTFKKKKVG